MAKLLTKQEKREKVRRNQSKMKVTGRSVFSLRRMQIRRAKGEI